MVRSGLETSSPLVEGRLATGSRVEELELNESQFRLHYRRVTGSGPDEGWISIKIPGKELARRIEEAAPWDASLWEVETPEGDQPEWDGLKLPKPRGKFVPEGTGRPRLEPWEPKLAKYEGKLQKSFPWNELLKNMPQQKFMGNIGELVSSGFITTGHHYGLHIPFSLELIQAVGAEWLTKALHAAGTLPEDNRVVEMQAREFVGGGACLKAVLDVKYEKPSEELHEKLFCKYPFSLSEEKLMGFWQWVCMTNNDAPEIDFARLLSAGAPMRTPKYYYGDICPKTGVSLLITECLAFPSEESDFGPMELEPIPHKAVDYLLDDPFAYYNAIVRNAARLAAWGFNGKLGKDVLTTFPSPELPSMFAMGVKVKIPKFLFFARNVAPQIFPPNYVDAAFEKSLFDCLLDVEGCQKELYDFLYADKALIGLTHQNMNIDNAFFWRNDEGKVESGFIDWGRFRQENYAQSLMNGFTCCDLPGMMHTRDRDFLQTFCDEFAKEYKPGILTFEKLWEHYMVNWCLQALFLVNLADMGIYPSWEYTRPEGWATIKSYKDPRVYNMPNCNNGWVAMIRQFTAGWKAKDIPGWWATWRKKNVKAPTPEEKAAALAAKKAAKAKAKA
mmetsp:Transcript_1515/g.3146  ORF Transcript_1515/g.3146 Transcript_1515/m.3146 type:complete len:616 (+) Transcript_1515:1-1848(+)